MGPMILKILGEGPGDSQGEERMMLLISLSEEVCETFFQSVHQPKLLNDSQLSTDPVHQVMARSRYGQPQRLP